MADTSKPPRNLTVTINGVKVACRSITVHPVAPPPLRRMEFALNALPLLIVAPRGPDGKPALEEFDG